MAKFKSIVSLIGILLIITACPPTNEINFINNTSTDIQIVISDNNDILEKFTISVNKSISKRTVDFTSKEWYTFRVFNSKKEELYSRKITAKEIQQKLDNKGRVAFDIDEKNIQVKRSQ